jgi:hypothetical protein
LNFASIYSLIIDENQLQYLTGKNIKAKYQSNGRQIKIKFVEIKYTQLYIIHHLKMSDTGKTPIEPSNDKLEISEKTAHLLIVVILTLVIILMCYYLGGYMQDQNAIACGGENFTCGGMDSGCCCNGDEVQ